MKKTISLFALAACFLLPSYGAAQTKQFSVERTGTFLENTEPLCVTLTAPQEVECSAVAYTTASLWTFEQAQLGSYLVNLSIYRDIQVTAGNLAGGCVLQLDDDLLINECTAVAHDGVERLEAGEYTYCATPTLYLQEAIGFFWENGPGGGGPGGPGGPGFLEGGDGLVAGPPPLDNVGENSSLLVTCAIVPDAAVDPWIDSRK